MLAVQAASADLDSRAVFSLQVAGGDAEEVTGLAAAGQASLVQLGAAS